jgi:hypothetical protein
MLACEAISKAVIVLKVCIDTFKLNLLTTLKSIKALAGKGDQLPKPKTREES